MGYDEDIKMMHHFLSIGTPQQKYLFKILINSGYSIKGALNSVYGDTCDYQYKMMYKNLTMAEATWKRKYLKKGVE